MGECLFGTCTSFCSLLSFTDSGINHEIASVSRNSGQGNYTPEPPKALIEKYRNLGSPYYTVDFAELNDGTWKIIEAGDGEVSGLSDNQDYKHYFRALYQCFK